MISKKQNFEDVVKEHNAWKARRDELLPRVKEARDAVLEAQADQLENRGDLKALGVSQRKLTDLEQKFSACERKMSESRTRLEKIAREELKGEIAQIEKQEIALQGEQERLVKQIARHLAQAQVLAECCVNATVFTTMLEEMNYKSPLLPRASGNLVEIHRNAFTEAINLERVNNATPDYKGQEQRLFVLRIMTDNVGIFETEIDSRIIKAIGRPEEPEEARPQPIFVYRG